MTVNLFSGSRNYISEHVDNFIWEDPKGTLITILFVEDNKLEVTRDVGK